MSANVKKDGYYTNGKQRYFCKNCRHSFRWSNAKTKEINEKEWFRRWLVEGYSVRQLSNQSGHSPRKLYRMINYYLKQMPPQLTWGTKSHYFIFDGTFLHRPRSLVALMDAQTHRLSAGHYPLSESSEPQLLAFFSRLFRDRLQPYSFTVDGNPHVIKVIRKLWPDVIIQRCLVHIQRQGLAWCRNAPKTPYARKLRDIFLQVLHIRSQAEQDTFLNLVADWEKSYGAQIYLKHETGYVFSDIKRARSMLLRALPDMFHYLINPLIPISTNGLEGYFSRLKSHYRQHRGLSKHKRTHYFRWYFQYVPK